jgi:hypothetical protein
MRLIPMGICGRPSVPTSDATIPSIASRANFAGHSQRRWAAVVALIGGILI